jgi:hypothetical protein
MVQNRFSENDPYVQTAKTILAVNNNVEFNVAQTENDFQRATSASFAQQSLTRNLANPVPDVTQSGQSTIGAALGGINQPPGAMIPSPINPCFTYSTPILMSNNKEQHIGDIEVGEWVKSFDSRGNLINCQVIGKYIHLVQEILKVTFEDERVTYTTAIHRYWTGEEFVPIFNLDKVLHWDRDWQEVNIVAKETINGEILVYNLEIAVYQTYLANGDGTHNLKPAPE